MKTFDQCKDEVANNDGDEFGWTTDYEFKLNFTSLKIMMTKAAELYAQEVAKDAWERAWVYYNERGRNPELAKAALEFNNIPAPQENIKWFVEHPETHLWWSGYKWTNDPNEAFGCDLKATADRYARFQRIEKYIITDHLFI